MLDSLHAGLGWQLATALLAVRAMLLPAAAILPMHGRVQLGSYGGRGASLCRRNRLVH